MSLACRDRSRSCPPRAPGRPRAVGSHGIPTASPQRAGCDGRSASLMIHSSIDIYPIGGCTGMVTFRRTLVVTAALVLGSALAVRPAQASTVADIGTPTLDPPTPATLGVRLPVPDDLDSRAAVAVRFRAAGTTDWHA